MTHKYGWQISLNDICHFSVELWMANFIKWYMPHQFGWKIALIATKCLLNLFYNKIITKVQYLISFNIFLSGN